MFAYAEPATNPNLLEGAILCRGLITCRAIDNFFARHCGDFDKFGPEIALCSTQPILILIYGNGIWRIRGGWLYGAAIFIGLSI